MNDKNTIIWLRIGLIEPTISKIYHHIWAQLEQIQSKIYENPFNFYINN
jgi:hypothetical protein